MNSLTGLITVYLILGIYGSPVSQIIGGYDAPDGLYPYQASLRHSENNRHVCGGAIISRNYVITAAHCFNHANDPSDILVAVGSNYLDAPRAVYEATTLLQHAAYNKFLSINDIGLVYVLQNIRFNENIQPIALPTTDRNYDNYNLVVTGWGRLWGGGPNPNHLQEIVVKGYSRTKCNKSYANSIVESQICTHMIPGTGMCNGDSGGPLVAEGVLVGILSFGTLPCGSGYPDVYTRVFSYRKWLNFHTGV